MLGCQSALNLPASCWLLLRRCTIHQPSTSIFLVRNGPSWRQSQSALPASAACPPPSRSSQTSLPNFGAPTLQEFDELLLLKRGGQTIFFGELGKGASSLVSYFEAFPGVPAMEKG